MAGRVGGRGRTGMTRSLALAEIKFAQNRRREIGRATAGRLGARDLSPPVVKCQRRVSITGWHLTGAMHLSRGGGWHYNAPEAILP
jgi:hypothetical protein